VSDAKLTMAQFYALERWIIMHATVASVGAYNPAQLEEARKNARALLCGDTSAGSGGERE